jgi:hypothetical protein
MRTLTQLVLPVTTRNLFIVRRDNFVEIAGDGNSSGDSPHRVRKVGVPRGCSSCFAVSAEQTNSRKMRANALLLSYEL